jgi:hypothetical protein
MNLLFYSNASAPCHRLLTLMKNCNILPYFKLICVDKNIDKMPKELNSVPTLLIAKMNKLLESDDAFRWVQSIKFINDKRMNMNMNNIIAKKSDNDEPQGHFDLEMSGLSDSFAYKDIDFAQPKTYVNAKGDNKNMILTAPKMKAITKPQQDLLLKNATNKRKEQNEIFKVTAKQQQLESVINAEKKNIMNNVNNTQMKNMRQYQQQQSFQQQHQIQQQQKMRQQHQMQQHIHQNQLHQMQLQNKYNK